MMDLFEEDKIILQKEVILSVLFWSVITYIMVSIINLTTILLVNLQVRLGSKISPFILAILVIVSLILPNIILAGSFYFALKKNWKRFNLIKYKFKASYISYIFILILIYDVLVNFIITKQFKWPAFGLISISLVFIIPLLIKNKKK
tara:strand:- start:131 stop:571 length:441 start_codon:yes stop_codon:yes gene_type:complete